MDNMGLTTRALYTALAVMVRAWERSNGMTVRSRRLTVSMVFRAEPLKFHLGVYTNIDLALMSLNKT